MWADPPCSHPERCAHRILRARRFPLDWGQHVARASRPAAAPCSSFPQHAGRHLRVIDLDQSFLALVAQPTRHDLADLPQRSTTPRRERLRRQIYGQIHAPHGEGWHRAQPSAGSVPCLHRSVPRPHSKLINFGRSFCPIKRRWRHGVHGQH